MKVALVQMGSVPGDFAATVERMLQMAGRAARAGADVALFPATVMGGAYPMGLAELTSFQLDMFEALADLAVRAPVPCAVPAYVVDSEAGYTEVFLCADGIVCPLRRRAALQPDGTVSGCAVAPAVCAIADGSIRFLADGADAGPQDAPCDVLVSILPMSYCKDDSSTLGAYGLAEGSLAPLESGGYGCFFVHEQGVGAYDDVVLAGGGFAATPDGVLAAVCPLFEEDVAVFDTHDDCLGTAPAAPKSALGVRVGTPVSLVPRLTQDEADGCLYRALVLSVRDYVRKSGFSDVAVGLSGGIDSSVVAAIASDALGPEHVRGLLMPGPFSSRGSVDDALELASRLGIRTTTVPITPFFEQMSGALREAFGSLGGLATENLQARLRGVALMSLSNEVGALVLNTGNKSESAMGYSTLYGDTVGAFAPLADVYKTGVYRLAAWRNGRGPTPVIPQNVIDKPPSAELSEGQTDEGSFGMSYETIDQILALHVDWDCSAQEVAAAGFDPADALHVISACAKAEYKRRQEPMGPIVSLRPFDDRGMPVVQRWRDSVRGDRPGRRAGGSACCTGCTPEDAPRYDVDEALNGMLVRASRQDQLVGMIGDVMFGTLGSVAGVDPGEASGPGLPIFSKN